MLHCNGCAKVSTLEARIAELTRERDVARANSARLADVMEGLALDWDANSARRELVAARAERDEAVGPLRRAKPVLDEVASLSDNTSLENMIATDIDAYLARLAATAPEKETTPPGPYSGT